MVLYFLYKCVKLHTPVAQNYFRNVEKHPIKFNDSYKMNLTLNEFIIAFKLQEPLLPEYGYFDA